ncbi:ABC transporter permease [Mucilaginibacter rigui]|uniref:ABC transporter permease n=1 Tax=Mucilaginibacter rigui TaxID=534635 RepID=A0ABR7X8M2_9SPHI|nr:ABC transporter permease [Mucilaginibacter rigui]MBD1385950.1 ABC transporter permease [Mucilaginibacter rigui]
MFKNYLLSAFRSLKKFKLFTFLNVFGLASGMACSILILLWVQDELSYDKFNADTAHTYRLVANVAGSDAAVTPPPVVTAMKQQMPKVNNVTRLVPLNATVTVGNQKFAEKSLEYADANFLQMFNYPLLQGDKNTVLSRPEGAVITEAAAIKYFGKVNAIGKVLHVDNSINGNNYVVTGVLKNLPHNSHLQFDVLLPIDYYNKDNGDVWDNFSVYSYVQLDSSVNATPAFIAGLEKQINSIYKLNDKSNTKTSYTLQPLTDIHLHSHYLGDISGQGNSQNVTIFLLVAVFILVIACINFMNLSTALGAQRAKEVGLRKTIGAMRFQLVTQFISESLLVSLLSLVIGIAIAWLLLPVFNVISFKAITIDLLDLKIIGELLLLAIFVGVISGSYPAFFMSSFKPVSVLKGLKQVNGQRSFLRSGLVIVQFSISVVLMISTLVVNSQLKFIRSRDVGFNKQNLLYMQMPQTGDLQNNYSAVKAAMQQQPGLADYTLINNLPTDLQNGSSQVTWPGKDPRQKQVLFPQIVIDGNFTKVFGMHILAGRTFDNNSKTDEGNYVLNETCVRVMGMTTANAIGQKISYNGQQGTVIGVVKDFNFKPVQQPIEPLILRNTNRGGFVVVRANPANMKQTIASLKSVFRSVYRDEPFSYGFVDQDLNRMYESESRTQVLFNTFSVVSIIISCLGLFGLATFTTQRRLKEIGVRKVLGANTTGIVAMLTKDFIKLVAMALLVAFPAAWFLMNKWLDSYVYRIQISWWMFAIAGMAAITISIITISYQSIRAALSNPVDSLKTE